ncbi:MAG: CusA/CzcA family heavy metal efflux RND transporter [Candidatus Eisenbacteria bacterium]
MDRLVTFALRQRLLVILVCLALIGFGVHAVNELPIDAFPDVTNVQVQILAEAPGMAPVEVEQLVTYPVEVSMSGLPGLAETRSLSKLGLSLTTVVFKDNVDIYFARQLVFERLQQAREKLPPGVDVELGPISTGLGEIYQYTLESPKRDAMELRTLQDWVVRPILRGVAGVTDVNSFGGLVKQYQVLVRPEQLTSYRLTLREVLEALAENNANASGGYIEHSGEQYVVRGLGLAKSQDDLGRVVVAHRGSTPIFVRDIADVTTGAEPRQGFVTRDGKGEAVAGIVLMLKGASGRDVVAAVKAKLATVQKALPRDVRVVPFYDRTELVDRAMHTVSEALLEGGVLVLLVLMLFLGNIRSALIVTLVLPLSALVAFIMLNAFGYSANLMSLGGLAIGIGMIVDGAVVMTENIFRHLAEDHGKRNIVEVVRESALEVARPIVFGISIITVVFLPLFTLEGFEGKMFAPLAFTIAAALAGSLVLSLTLVPVLSTFILKGKLSEKDTWLVARAKALYLPALAWCLKRWQVPVGLALAGLIVSGVLFTRLGREFLPPLDEGAIGMQTFRLPSVSLTTSRQMELEVERVLRSFPEITTVVSKTGRADIASDPMGLEVSDVIANLRPRSEWKTAKTREELVEAIRTRLESIPGMSYSFSQPIQLRVDELVSGVKAQVAIKIVGDDLTVLREQGEAVERVIRQVRGAADVNLERTAGTAYLDVDIDRERIARYGINVADIQAIIETAIGGSEATVLREGQRSFAVVVKFPEAVRSDPAHFENLMVTAEDGQRVPLSQLAHIRVEEGPAQVSRESGQRRIVIECNVTGRDMGSFVADAQRAVAREVTLPPGYFITWGGQFENQQRAMARLSIVVPLVVLLIFLLLFTSFSSLRNAILIVLNIPFALIGGVIGLFISGQNLSVAASVGFIALFGVAVLNGVVMVSYFNQLRREGATLEDAVLRGGELRLRPVLMTALVGALGLIPLLIASGPGSEIQRPLASVVVGGLVTSTLLTLFLLPILYRWLERRDVEF